MLASVEEENEDKTKRNETRTRERERGRERQNTSQKPYIENESYGMYPSFWISSDRQIDGTDLIE